MTEPNASDVKVSAVRPSSANVELVTFQPGDRIADRYVVEGVLGIGGMAYVVAARHEELDERVAIKFLRPDAAENPEVVARFAREARACVRIKSEHVARVFDVGTLADGTPFIVMEYLEGQDLGAILRERGMLSIPEAALLAMQACEALAAAHANGVIHRDVKPENLFVTTRDDGTPILKVLDFGISKVALTGSAFGVDLELVKTLSLMGSPLYMSPEQIRATRDVDQRTDIWSLGVVLYELLTGRNAFNGSSITELTALILEAHPDPLRGHRADIPSDLEHVVLRTLEKDPAHRYQNVAELSAALVRFAPKRARVSAERTSAVLVKAGLSVPTAPFPSTVPPPPELATGLMGGMPYGTVSSVPMPRDSRVPSIPSMQPTGFSHPPRTSMMEPPRRSTGTIVLGVLGVVVLLAGALVVGAQFGRRHPVAASAPLPAPPAAAAPAAVAAIATDVPPAPVVAEAVAPSAPAPSPVASASAAPAVSAKPQSSHRGSRKTRKSNDDEPDLGF